jgi:hypothetical protein
MSSETTVLLEPTNANLKDPLQCSYREGKICYKYNLDSFKVLDIMADLSNKSGKPSMSSMEAVLYFTIGFDDKVCEIQCRGYKDYCKEGCVLNDCEYNGREKRTS